MRKTKEMSDSDITMLADECFRLIELIKSLMLRIVDTRTSHVLKLCIEVLKSLKSCIEVLNKNYFIFIGT